MTSTQLVPTEPDLGCGMIRRIDQTTDIVEPGRSIRADLGHFGSLLGGKSRCAMNTPFGGLVLDGAPVVAGSVRAQEPLNDGAGAKIRPSPPDHDGRSRRCSSCSRRPPSAELNAPC